MAYVSVKMGVNSCDGILCECHKGFYDIVI